MSATKVRRKPVRKALRKAAARTRPKPRNGSQVGELAARVARLEAEAAIRKLLARYCKAVDERDLETIKTLFTEDAYVKVIPWSEHRGKQAVVDFFAGYFVSGWQEPRHYITNQIIDVNGSEATAFSYLFETVAKNGESVVGCGTYADRLRCTDGVWRFQEKIITVLFMTPILKGWAGADKIVSWA
jgi:uncharacterized protein (TIGR02246 family)